MKRTVKECVESAEPEATDSVSDLFIDRVSNNILSNVMAVGQLKKSKSRCGLALIQRELF